MQAAQGAASITSFYSQQKKPTSTAALPTKDTSDISELPRGVRPPSGLAAAMGGGATAGDAIAGSAAAGGFRRRDPGAGLGDAPLAPQPKFGPLRGMPANEPADDSRQPISKAGSTALSQPPFDQSVQVKHAAHLHAATSRADMQNPQKSDRDTEDGLVLQSRYAMHLRQQQGGQAAELRQMRSSSSSGAYTGDQAAYPSEGAGRQPDCHCTVDLAGSNSRTQQHQGESVAEHGQHRPVEGLLDFGTRASHLPRSPDTVTARGQLFLSPKRGVSACEEDEPITVNSDSHSEGELEISLLSPSPAKRYVKQTLQLMMLFMFCRTSCNTKLRQVICSKMWTAGGGLPLVPHNSTPAACLALRVSQTMSITSALLALRY